jgi:uncharacterized protein (DUF1786 family)
MYLIVFVAAVVLASLIGLARMLWVAHPARSRVLARRQLRGMTMAQAVLIGVASGTGAVWRKLRGHREPGGPTAYYEIRPPRGNRADGP